MSGEGFAYARWQCLTWGDDWGDYSCDYSCCIDCRSKWDQLQGRRAS